MRMFGRILGYFVVLVIILIGVSFALPKEVTVARTVSIDAPAEAIFPHVNSLLRQRLGRLGWTAIQMCC